MRKEKNIAEKVEYLCVVTISTVYEMNLRQEKALIESSENIHMLSNVLRILGHSAVMGKERFFELPNFWVFQAQKDFMLIKSLERMKAAGLVYYLLKQAEMAQLKVSVRGFVDQAELEKGRRESTTDFTCWNL